MHHCRRNYMKKNIIFSVLVCCLLVSCGGRGPQRPTHHSGQKAQEDTAAIALMELNQRMAAEADNLLLRYVEQEDEAYALHSISNAWVHYVAHGEDGPSPQRNERWRMRLRTKNLSGQLLIDEEREYVIGQHELPTCIELASNEMHHGDMLIMVAPWYSAYGMHGNADIPPYTNVIIEIEVL